MRIARPAPPMTGSVQSKNINAAPGINSTELETAAQEAQLQTDATDLNDDAQNDRQFLIGRAGELIQRTRLQRASVYSTSDPLDLWFREQITRQNNDTHFSGYSDYSFSNPSWFGQVHNIQPSPVYEPPLNYGPHPTPQHDTCGCHYLRARSPFYR